MEHSPSTNPTHLPLPVSPSPISPKLAPSTRLSSPPPIKTAQPSQKPNEVSALPNARASAYDNTNTNIAPAVTQTSNFAQAQPTKAFANDKPMGAFFQNMMDGSAARDGMSSPGAWSTAATPGIDDVFRRGRSGTISRATPPSVPSIPAASTSQVAPQPSADNAPAPLRDRISPPRIAPAAVSVVQQAAERRPPFRKPEPYSGSSGDESHALPRAPDTKVVEHSTNGNGASLDFKLREEGWGGTVTQSGNRVGVQAINGFGPSVAPEVKSTPVTVTGVATLGVEEKPEPSLSPLPARLTVLKKVHFTPSAKGGLSTIASVSPPPSPPPPVAEIPLPPSDESSGASVDDQTVAPDSPHPKTIDPRQFSHPTDTDLTPKGVVSGVSSVGSNAPSSTTVRSQPTLSPSLTWTLPPPPPTVAVSSTFLAVPQPQSRPQPVASPPTQPRDLGHAKRFSEPSGLLTPTSPGIQFPSTETHDSSKATGSSAGTPTLRDRSNSVTLPPSPRAFLVTPQPQQRQPSPPSRTVPDTPRTRRHVRAQSLTQLSGFQFPSASPIPPITAIPPKKPSPKIPVQQIPSPSPSPPQNRNIPAIVETPRVMNNVLSPPPVTVSIPVTSKSPSPPPVAPSAGVVEPSKTYPPTPYPRHALPLPPALLDLPDEISADESARVRKHANYALSALEYDDLPTVRRELLAALALLGIPPPK